MTPGERSQRDVDLESTPPQPIRFGVMAGKGGVGKTLIACNFARVLSWSIPIAVVDLDLYNRGASALLVEGGISPDVGTVYSLLERATSGEDGRPADRDGDQEPNWKSIDKWLEEFIPETVEPATKDGQAYYLVPSSVTGDPVARLEYGLSVAATRNLLLRLSDALVERFHVRGIVFDCKAGPDPLALAVVGLATETLLVSEYNPITFDGTLNFYQHICKEYGAADLIDSRIGPLNVIINKVPEKFDLSKSDTLVDLSDRLRPLHLLDAFPFEYDVFQGFGDFKFVVDTLPETTFSAKVARLAERLLERRPIKLDTKVRTAARRAGRRVSRGVRGRRHRVLLFVALLGVIFVLLGLSVPIGLKIVAGGVGSIEQPTVTLAAIAVAATAGIMALAAVLFRLFRD